MKMDKEYIEFFWGKMKGKKLTKSNIDNALNMLINKVAGDYY